MKNYESNANVKQLGFLTVVEERKRVPANRVDIMSFRILKETSLVYKNRTMRSPEDGYNLFKQFLEELNRKCFVVMCLDVKSQPTASNIWLSFCCIYIPLGKYS